MSTTSNDSKTSTLLNILSANQEQLLAEWLQEMAGSTRRNDLIKDSDLRAQCSQFLRVMQEGLEKGGSNFQSPVWDPMRAILREISGSRAQQGFTPTETAMFV